MQYVETGYVADHTRDGKGKLAHLSKGAIPAHKKTIEIHWDDQREHLLSSFQRADTKESVVDIVRLVTAGRPKQRVACCNESGETESFRRLLATA